MANSLPSFFKLPTYYSFDYKPRFYDKEKKQREAQKRRINFNQKSFHRNSNITDQIYREREDSKRKMRFLSLAIRTALVILFVIIAFLLAKYFGLLIESSL
ncbi:MAG: hypothetical protein U9R42_06635 [Bacteroidota bacterium]|nr:hypothetical protein [Bacteroidota bacterium]